MRPSDKAYYLIRKEIIALDFPPLSPIVEQMLMEDSQLGRTSFREVLRRLAAEAPVFLASRQGILVSGCSTTDLLRMLERAGSWRDSAFGWQLNG